MALKQQDGTFNCGICGANYTVEARADLCKQNHSMIYFPITKSELNFLLMAIKMGEMSVLSEDLLNRLENYNRKTLTSE